MTRTVFVLGLAFFSLILIISSDAYAIDFRQDGLEVTQLTSYKIQDEPYEEHLILGEVENTADTTVQIAGSFTDLRVNCVYHYPTFSETLQKTIMSEDTCTIFVAGDHYTRYNIPPGDTIPFSFRAYDSAENILIEKLEFFKKPGILKPQLLSICCVNVEKISGPSGGVQIIGELVNDGIKPANVESLSISIYDKQGNILETKKTFIDSSFFRQPGIDPETSQPYRNSAEFKTVLNENPQNAKMYYNYKIFAESEEYTTIPEFSELVLLTLAGSILFMFLLFRKIKNSKLELAQKYQSN